MYKVEYNYKGISAKIVADSCSDNGDRITTFELEYPRFIHGELMTHRLFSRNAMSSRAVPVKTMIEQVTTTPASPIHWGKNQAGMQAKEELSDVELYIVQNSWEFAAQQMALIVEHMNDFGVHKQIANRLLEPFQTMKTIVTATEFDNFFWLRLDSSAQPEINKLAQLMFQCMESSTPELLINGEYHTPYVEHQRNEFNNELVYIVEDLPVSTTEAIAISSSCCAQVSYRRLDNTYDKALSVYERLGVGSNKIHASPFEHIATPMEFSQIDILRDGLVWEDGITLVDREGNFWSGNFKGWIQHRQTLDNHTCWSYNE